MTDTVSELSPLKRALIAVEDMRARVAAAEGAAREPIAIVGMGCRMPGGVVDPASFWNLLVNGVDAVGEIPADRWSMDELYDPDPDVPGRIVRAGGFVDAPDQFDPQFFGISPREAVTLDPQQRLLLEVSWEALEAAGIAPASLVGTRAGVYVGIGIYDYGHVIREAMEVGAIPIDAYVGTGNSASVAAGRIAFALGLNGPAMSVDTACSSSLVSVHLACQGLRTRESDVAIAGGVNLIFTPGTHIYMSQLRALSPSGRCRTFDASADGYVRSEGAAMIVLKRLSDARASGDTVLAVIRGTAVNHDGRSAGLTVPNGAAQQEVIRSALADARIDPSDVEFVETHGTGTPLGDPIEVRALDAVYGKDRDEPLRIGSVKTNIGHLESASGIAGLLKLVLALQRDHIPPHLHLTEPTPHLAWDELAIEVPTDGRPWPRGDTERIGGINSFGLSGTNSHILISDPPPPYPVEATDGDERSVHTVILSARSSAGLRELATATAAALGEPEAPSLGDAAFTLSTGRNVFGHRLAVAAATATEAADALTRFANDEPSPLLVARDVGLAAEPTLAFLFTGQGSQYAGMGAELYRAEPTFRAALDHCDAVLGEHLDRPLLSVLHPADGETSPIDDTTYTQPALFSLEYALAQLWASWGVRPEMMLGHSIGSYVAAHLAGVMSLEDALVLVATRGRLMGSLPAGGSMASVFAPEAAVVDAVAAIGGRLSIAAINGPDNTVISGPAEEVAAALAALDAEGVESRPLTTSHAFHSELMEPILADFDRVASGITLRPPQRRRMVSDLTGAIAGDEVASTAYWVEHLRRAVRFADGMATLHREGCNVFLELGPAPILSAMGRRCLATADVAWAASLQRDRSDVTRIGIALGELWAAGATVDWVARDEPYHRRRVVMPTARFQRQRYWVPAFDNTVGRKKLSVGHPLLGSEVVSSVGRTQFESGINRHRPVFIGDRVIHGRVELAAPVFAETALALAAELWGQGAFEVTDLVAFEPVVVDDTPVIYGTVVERRDRTSATLTVRVGGLDGAWWDLAATARVSVLGNDELTTVVPPVFVTPSDEGDAGADATALFETWRENGLVYRSRAVCIDAVWSGPLTATARLVPPFGADAFAVYPPLLEVCALALVGGKQPRALKRIDRIRVVSDADPRWCVRELGDPDDDTLWFFDADGQLVAAASGFQFDELAVESAPPSRQWVFDVAWRALGDEPIPTGSRPPMADGAWLLVGPESQLDALAAELIGRATTVVRLDPTVLVDDVDAAAAAIDGAFDADGALSCVVFAPPTLGDDLPAATEGATRALLHLVQLTTEAAWRRGVPNPPRLWLLTRGAMPVAGDATALVDGALWGLVRTVGVELPLFYGGMVDLDQDADDDPALLVDLFTSSGDETWLARRAGDTYVARMRAAPPARARGGVVTADGAYLVTGGFGALGLATARALVERGARRVVLVGRSSVPPRPTWSTLAADDPARPRVDAIRELEALGASVHVGSFDVADREALAAFVADYRAEGWPPIRGVFHAAGVLRDRSVSDMTDDDVATVLGPKVDGTWNLHEVLADEPIDHFVLFSSAAGLLGSPGQANYAAANAFMDVVAHVRRAQGLPALSVNWGAWDAGMAAREDLEVQRGRQGQLAIPVAAGMDLMFDLLDSGAVQALVLPMTRDQLSAAAAAPLLSELVDTTGEVPVATERRDHGAEILGAPEDQRPSLMLELLCTRIGSVLGLEADVIEPQSELVALGLDSIMIVEMTTRLSVELGVGLNPREVFQEPSVHSLVGTLVAALAGRAAAAPTGEQGDGPLPGDGSVLVVAAPGSGIAAVRTTLAAAAPSGVDAGSTYPTVDSFAEPTFALTDELATDVEALEALTDALPGLHVVHLVRHPFAAVAELTPSLGQRGAETAWHTANGNLLDLADRLGPDRVRMVRLEDLIEGGQPVDALLGIVGLEREVGSPGGAPVLDGERLDDWRTVDLAEAPGRGLRQIADELGYDTTWPVESPVPTRGSGV